MDVRPRLHSRTKASAEPLRLELLPIESIQGRAVSEIVCQRTFHGNAVSVAFFSGLADPGGFSREVIEASPDCFKILDLRGDIAFMNRNGQCLLEVGDFNQIAGRPFVSLWPETERRKVEVALSAARAGDTARFSAYCPTLSGAQKWWDVIVYCVEDRAGNPAHLVAISRDVTAAVRAQEDLQAMLEELRGLLEVNNRLQASAA